jgi:hypothetical protein
LRMLYEHFAGRSIHIIADSRYCGRTQGACERAANEMVTKMVANARPRKQVFNGTNPHAWPIFPKQINTCRHRTNTSARPPTNFESFKHANTLAVSQPEVRSVSCGVAITVAPGEKGIVSTGGLAFPGIGGIGGNADDIITRGGADCAPFSPLPQQPPGSAIAT